MRRPKVEKTKWFWKKTTISVVLVTMGMFFLTEGFKAQIGPNLDAVSRIKAKTIVIELIHETIKEEFTETEAGKELFLIKTGKDGKVQLVQANTALMNKMVSSFSQSLQKKYAKLEDQEVNLSYGSLIGSKLLSQSGMGISIKILPLSVTKCDYETEFESQGINQTKYKVYITLESSVRILQPFSDRNIKIKNKVLLSEAVIVGDVPDSYVNVPKEDILDVI